MAKKTFWDIIEQTIEAAGVPLSAEEIWLESGKGGIRKDFISTGKTPAATISAYCYTDISKNGEKSLVVQTSVRPVKFFLRRLISKDADIQQLDDILRELNAIADNTVKENDTEYESLANKKTKFKERDLHQLLVTFTNGYIHFRSRLKTIYHENSSKGTKGQHEWLHPDLVGAYFPHHYAKEIIQLQTELATTSIRIFSFEVKISLDFNNLREAYFQAVSNSSWANEGYLVTLHIKDDPALIDELRRLNNAFGIGVIKLNKDAIFESEIILPAVFRPEIDWDTANRLFIQNKGFENFLSQVILDSKARGTVVKEGKVAYDEILNVEELAIHIKEKGIQ